MRSNVLRWVLMAGLAGGTLIGIADVSAQPRDRRPTPRGERYAEPHDAPPPVRVERSNRRRGFVFGPGNWDWRDGRWEWTAGHFERQRIGRRFREIRWEKRGDIYVRLEGEWIDAGAPPALKEERFDPRPGFLFVRGRWDWDNGQWTWRPGSWVRDRKGDRWREGKWEQRNGEWVFLDGGWEAGAAGYPTSAPPPPPNDPHAAAGPDQVWIPGHHEWRGGRFEWKAGAFDRKRRGFRFEAGGWEKRGDRFEWRDGQWVEDFATSAPPAPRNEVIPARQGWVFLRGHWDWRDGQWAWVDGRWEKEHLGEQWVEGRWENRNNRWMWTDGSWQPSLHPTKPPPPPVNEPIQTRAGYAWAFGFHRWIRGAYVWQPGQLVQGHAGERHIPHEWVQRGDHYEMLNDRWERTAPPPPPPPPAYSGPTSAPPPSRAETYNTKPGFIWARGHHDWQNGGWVWVAGHWEREVPYKKWVDAHWDQRGNQWFFTPGSWQ